MEKITAENILGHLAKLSDLLTEYEKQTDLLCSVDPTDDDEFNLIVIKRERIIDLIKELKPELSTAVEVQDEEDRKLIKRMLNGEAITTEIPKKLRGIQESVINVLSQQRSILEKDEIVRRRCKVRYDEIKDSLEELKQDKKRIDFYSTAKVKGLGGKLDSNS